MISRPSLRVDYIVCVLLGLSLLLCLPSYGQVAGATLSGTVTDSSGGLVANVKISIKNVGTGVARDAATDAAGFYTASNLAAGPYEISASAAGFSTQVRSGITLTVGAQQVLNLTMQVGTVAQKVEVIAAAPTVQLSSSSLSSEVDETTIRELPLNGRDWTQLATLQPGVASIASLQPTTSGIGSGAPRIVRGFGSGLTISGARPQENNYRVDGIMVLDYSNNVPGDALGVALGVDSIREFSVVSSNYSAEYGRTAGGVINAITRSGTNELHGDAYEFLRNSALDARNYFDGATIPEFRRNQFGVAAGAPIKKDNTFIFADYEGLRQSLGLTSRPLVPSADARNGIIHNANGTTTTIKVDPQVAPFLSIYALPNAGLVGAGNTGTYAFVSQQAASENFVTTRIDHVFSGKDSLSGTYLHDSALVTLPDALNTILKEEQTGNQRVALEETHIFSTQMTNAVRFGFNRVNNIGGKGITAINPAAANLALGSVPGFDAAIVSVSGLAKFGAGQNAQNVALTPWNSFQGYDDANLIVGRHSLKFGVNVEHDQDNKVANSGLGGQFNFGSLNALLLNQPTSFTVTLSPNERRHYRETIFGAYVQDDIRWRPNLTINLGLRYEMSRVPTEIDNKLTVLWHMTDATPHLGNPFFYNPTLRNFAPRVGFAWDPFGDGKTAVRSGFGIFDVLPILNEYEVNEGQLYPFTLSGAVPKLPAGTFPGGAFALAQNTPLQQQGFLDPNIKRNYVMQWNLSVQREVAPGLTIMGAYVGSHGVHNPFLPEDINMVLPTLTSAGYLWPNPATNPSVLNPNWGKIGGWFWNDNSFYDALEVQVIQRLSHGFQIQGSYTWGKSIDQGSSTGVPDQFSNSDANLFFFDPKGSRSLSDYNVKNNLVINSTWMLPKRNWGNFLANEVLGGWQFGGIFQARTGLPFTPVIGGDPLGTLDSGPEDYPNRVGGSGCASAVNSGSINYINVSCFALPTPTPAIAAQCVAFKTVPGTCQNLVGNSKRNSLIGPGLTELDFSVFKNNYIGHSERLNAQFRAEFFNILNHSNFNSPLDNLTVFNADGSPTGGAGLIDSTSTTSRQIQFGLKLIW